MRIVVTEYPKAGGSWVVSMLGDSLQAPKRDIYVQPGFKAFDVGPHPWYRDGSPWDFPDPCVIKSHERPGSPLVSFPARFVQLVRDGRDVVVSKFFYERDFCVANGIYERFDTPFDQYVPGVAREWRDYVEAWLAEGVPVYRYEDFLADAPATVGRLLRELDLPVADDRILAAVTGNTKDRFHRSLDQTFKHNTFVRKGVAGDWRRHFRPEHLRAFRDAAGDALRRLGYEVD